MKQIRIQNDFDEWRAAARALLSGDVPPDRVVWVESVLDNALIPGLLGASGIPDESSGAERSPAIRVSRAFLDLARTVACHRDPSRWSILYRVLFRLTHGEPHLLELVTDDDVRTLASMEKQVRFDAHKMKAFVRFRKIIAPDGSEHFIAFHRSEHHVLKPTAPFFARRFGVMNWSILTPLLSAYWNGSELRFGPGAEASEARDDELEALWKTYYASTFNPARIKLKAMRKEMPARYWATLPETQLIPELLHSAPRRVEEMMARKTSDYPTAEAFLPEKLTLPQLREAAAGCRGCPLYERGTQTVFGEGAKSALAVFVGEQPGDQEDLAGKPFIGPAGQLFDSVLERVGIDRRQLYVTNAVKHFKWEPRGKRRIHSKPSAREVQACKPWLVAEVGVIKPPIVVAMGATAAQALLGPTVRITKDRGRPMESQWAPWTMVTVHPSALLRAPDEQMRQQMMAAFTDDLRQVARELRRVTDDGR